MKKLNLEKRKAIQPFLEKNVDEKKKVISPLIATILLVVVAVAIISIVFFGGVQDFINFNKTNYTDVVANLPYVYYPSGQTNTVLYINTLDSPRIYLPSKGIWLKPVSLCDELTAHGYSDWYLPSAIQMKAIWESCPDQNKSNACMNKNIKNKITGWEDIGSNWYWTKTKHDSSYAFSMDCGSMDGGNKDYNTNLVRCVRDP